MKKVGKEERFLLSIQLIFMQRLKGFSRTSRYRSKFNRRCDNRLCSAGRGTGWEYWKTSYPSSGLPESVPALTLDRKCGSAQQAIDSALKVVAGAYDVAIAGGVEMMSVVPMKLNRMGKR